MTILQGAQCDLQRQDRAGALGGQDLGGLAAGALKLQGMFKGSDAVMGGLGTSRSFWRLLLLSMVG